MITSCLLCSYIEIIDLRDFYFSINRSIVIDANTFKVHADNFLLYKTM